MRPLEILGMVEEACGTRLYEVKKTQAQKTMEKKDSKVNEITKILDEGRGCSFVLSRHHTDVRETSCSAQCLSAMGFKFN